MIRKQDLDIINIPVVSRLAAAVYAGRVRLRRWIARQWIGFCEAMVQSRGCTGQNLVEYTLILGLVALVGIGALSQVGLRTNSVYEKLRCTISASLYYEHQGSHFSDNRCKK